MATDARIATTLAILPILFVGSIHAGTARAQVRTPRADQRPARPSPGSPYDDAPRLVTPAPGTVVRQGPPTGWTHLVLKSIPKLASGEVQSIPGSGRVTATRFRTTILADVQAARDGRSGYVLKRIGLGICTPIQGRDTIISSRSVAAQGVALSTIEGIVLERTEQEVGRGRLLARSPTFALLSAPATLLNGGHHRPVVLRYAFLVEPTTGALQTAVWALDAAPEARRPARELVWLPPSLVYECGMDVQASRVLKVPVSWSFAMRTLPPGRPIAVPPALRDWSARSPRTPADVVALERALRAATLDPDGHSDRSPATALTAGERP